MRRLIRRTLHRAVLACGFRLTRAKPFERCIRRFQLDHDDFYFVQVGAYNGVTSDPFCPFILEGTWSGILVEPQQRFYDVLEEIYRDREDIICRNVAVGPEDGTATLYRIRDDAQSVPHWAPQLASFNYDVIAGHREEIPNIEELIVSEDVPSRTLATLIREAELPRLDLLATDTEGSDFEIVKQIDQLEMKPWFIHYEDRHLSSEDRDASRNFLTERGYRFVPTDIGESFVEQSGSTQR